MPSTTDQCFRYVSFDSFCFAAFSAGESVKRSAGLSPAPNFSVPMSMSACHPVRSLPLKISVKPSFASAAGTLLSVSVALDVQLSGGGGGVWGPRPRPRPAAGSWGAPAGGAAGACVWARPCTIGSAVKNVSVPNSRTDDRFINKTLLECPDLLRQTKDKHRTLTGTDDVLLAIDSVADRSAGVRTTEIDMPEQFACLGIEGDEVALHASGEHQVACRREHARLGVIDHLEFPLLFTGRRVERADCAVSFVFLSELRRRTRRAASRGDDGGRRGGSGVTLALLPLARVVLRGARCGILPRRDIEKSRVRAV